MSHSRFSRRTLLQGGVAASALLTSRLASAQAAPDKSAVVLVYLRGGFNGLFGSADTFIPGAWFGCSGTNVLSLPSTGGVTPPLVLDNAPLGPTPGFASRLPPAALANLASIGVAHGVGSHTAALAANWTTVAGRSYPLIMANAMGGAAPIKCAVVGTDFPPGPRPAEGTVSMQQVTDLAGVIAALGGSTPPDVPQRPKGAAALIAARAMSAARLTDSPVSLKSVKEAYDSAIAVLQSPTTAFDYPAIAAEYGVGPTSTGVSAFNSQMLAAELMIMTGSNVVIAMHPGGGAFPWDTHGDVSGTTARTRMATQIVPGLRTFLQRMMTRTGFNVTVAVFGEFARSLPGSDHARVVSPLVFGKKVRRGTTGRIQLTGPASQTVSLVPGTPAVPGFYSYLYGVTKVAAANPFGAVPAMHAPLVLP